MMMVGYPTRFSSDQGPAGLNQLRENTGGSVTRAQLIMEHMYRESMVVGEWGLHVARFASATADPGRQWNTYTNEIQQNVTLYMHEVDNVQKVLLFIRCVA